MGGGGQPSHGTAVWVDSRQEEAGECAGTFGLSDVGSEPEKFVVSEFAESGTGRAPCAMRLAVTSECPCRGER